MKINLLFILVLITLICSCKKSGDNVDPGRIPPEQNPTITYDKSKMKAAYAYGDTVQTVVSFRDNGFGKFEVIRPVIGTKINDQSLDTILVSPPSTSYDYNFKWVVSDLKYKGASNVHLNKGDSLRLDFSIKYLDKRYGNNFDTHTEKLNKKIEVPSFVIK